MNTKTLLLNVILAVLCLSASATTTETLSVEPVSFDNALYADYLGSAVESVPDLISTFESRQLSILPILLPDPDFIHLEDGGLLPFDPAAFPPRLVRRLIPVDEHGIIVYPVTIMEVPDSGERQILNAAGEVIAEIRAPRDYDPLWYVRLRFPDLDALDAETAAWRVALYDPSRIMVRFRLITEDELIRKVMAESLAATQTLPIASPLLTPMALSYPGDTGSGLAFDALSVQTNGTVDVSLSWPSGTLASDGLDIFSSTNLLEAQWQILLTTNVNNASGSFAFNAPSAGSGGMRFLDAWTHYDGDGDALYDGREVRLYGTDRFDADSDGDGMPDGWELQQSFDPLDDADALEDADGDGLTNLGEYQAGTDPHNSDTDGDDIPDDWEVQFGLNPLDAEDAEEDPDGDGYLNIYEYVHESNPQALASIPAPTLTVNETQSIQSALSAITNDYGIINVSPGTYTGSGNRNLSFNGKRITLISEQGAANTIIDAQSLGRGFVITSNETRRSVISGLTIQNGDSGEGGGIYINSASPSILNSTIISNSAALGGGISAGSGSPAIRNCLITENIADSAQGGWGGGIDSASGSTLHVYESIINKNYSGNLGGGISVFGADSTVIERCLIADNWADDLGGGVYTAAGSTVIIGSQIELNYSAQGGGLYSDDNSTLSMINSVLAANEAEWLDGGITSSGGGVNLKNSVIVGNFAFINAGGSLVADDVIVNSIIYGNTAESGVNHQIEPNTNAIIAYCDVQGGWSGEGNTNANPQFTRLGYRLTTNSPCIGAGSLSYAASTDIDGEARSLTTDMGIDQFVDTNSDGMADAWEVKYFGTVGSELAAGDYDGDFLGNLIEYEFSTDPTVAIDSDSDGLGDDAELYYGTDANDWDSDDDQMPDRWEVEFGLNPLSGADANTDNDSDNLTNFEEMQYGTDPLNADTDSDGLDDDVEILQGTDPVLDDTDGDGLNDGLEDFYDTDPHYWDSDGDGMSDGWEHEHGLDPDIPSDPSADTDGDGWTNAEEANQETDPTNEDTDGDGTEDGVDADPLDPDNTASASVFNTTEMTLMVGDQSGSHTERYKLAVGPYQVYMSHVSSTEYEFYRTIRVPRGKTYQGYLESLPDDDDDGDYTADVTGGGVMVDDPWDDPSGRVLGGHHEDSGFNSGQRSFTVTIAGAESDEESTDHVDADAVYANSVDPINTINGNVTVNDTDLVIPASGIPLVLSRAYDSRSIYTNSPVGACWSHSYDWHLADVTNHVYRGVSNDWKVLRTGSGDLHWFAAQTNGTFKSPAGVDYRLTDKTSSYELRIDGQITFAFATNGLLLSMTDPHGNALSFAYTTSGNKQVVSSVAHNSGPSLAFSYTNGMLTHVNSPTNSLYVTYSYNGQGELTGATRYASGQTFNTTYGYGAVHSLTQRVNAAGDKFDFGYTIVANTSGVVIAKGTSMALNTNWYAHTVAYNTASNRSTLTYQRDGTNQVYDYRYDPDTLAISAIYGPNRTNLVTRYTRDAAHNVTRVKTVDEATGEYLLSSMSYDARHNLASSAVGYNALPLHTWNYAWNLTNNTLLSASDPLGNQTTFEYDDTLLVATHEYPASNVTLSTSVGYTTNGLLAAVTNANGHWNRCYYGSHGFVTSAVPQAGPTVNYAYNTLGHLTALTLPGASGNRTTTFIPDAMGRVSSVTYPLGGLSESFAYDKMGNLTNHTDTAGRNTRFTYLPTRKLSSVSRGSGAEKATVRFDYDQQFNTLTIKDSLDRDVETYQLDIQDRPVTISNVESQTMSVVYGVGDIVKSVTRFDGTTVSNSYDTSARLTEIQVSGLSLQPLFTTFSYYDNALLKTVTSESGTVSNTYDQASRLTAEHQSLFASSASFVVEYGLDGIGNATNILVSVDGSTILTNRYAFDAAERVSVINGTGGTFAFNYGPYNGLVAGVSNSTSGIRGEYQFDNLDRLTNIIWRNAANGILRSFGYGYNSAGMITNVARETATETVAYGYDSLDRLKSANASFLTASYGWDLVGNPTSRVENATNTSYTLGTGNKLVSWTGGSYGHNAADCVTNITRGSDSFGLAWDSRYNLMSVSTNGTVAESYNYSPLGNRITTVVNGVTNHHVYEGAHCIADLDADGELLRSYQPGPGVDNWLSMTVHTGAAPVVYTYLTDHLGTVHAVANAYGLIVESYRYDPHGKVLGVWNGSGTPLTKSAIGNRILWQGREYSWATGLHYFRARWYDPITGRWLSNDPIGINGGLNQYGFCGNNPVMFVDPLGLATLNNLNSRLRFSPSEINQMFTPLAEAQDDFENIELAYLGMMGAAVAAPYYAPYLTRGYNIGKFRFLKMRHGPWGNSYELLKWKNVLRLEAHPTARWMPRWLFRPHAHIDFLGSSIKKLHIPILEPILGYELYQRLFGSDDDASPDAGDCK